VLCVLTLYILVFDVGCFMISNVVFMERTDRECSLAGLVLYCVTVCILVLGVECVTVSNVVFLKGTNRQ